MPALRTCSTDCAPPLLPLTPSAQVDAEQSHGIAKPGDCKDEEARKAKEAKKAKDAAEMPELAQNAIRTNMSDYEYLSAKATR